MAIMHHASGPYRDMASLPETGGTNGRLAGVQRLLLVRVNAAVAERVGHPRNCRVPFTLKHVEAFLKQQGRGDQVRVLDCLVDPQPLDQLLAATVAWSPDLLVATGTTLDLELLLTYGRRVKEQLATRIPWLIGVGEGVTSNPVPFLAPHSPFDLVLPGEAEGELIAILRRLQAGEGWEGLRRSYLQRLHTWQPLLVSDLDALPFPSYRSPDDLKRYRFIYPLRLNGPVVWGQVQSSRGCPYDCIFCTQVIRESYDKAVRLRSPANVADEIEYLMGQGANVINFVDDNFTSSKRHVEAVCAELRRRHLGIPWIAHARVDNITPGLLHTMQEAGCILLRFGIESGSRRILQLLKKAPPRVDWLTCARETFREARRIGLATDAMFIIGNPTETREEIEASIHLALELGPDMIQVHFFTPYPGTDSYAQFKERISTEDIPRMYHYDISPVNLSQVPQAEMKRLQTRFYRRFLLRPGFILRHLRHYAPFYLRNRQVLKELLAIRRALS